MKIDRKRLLTRLQLVAPGLAARELIEQTTSLAFVGGRVCTYNDEVAASVESPLKVECAVPAKPLLLLLAKLPDKEVDVGLAGNELVVKGKGRRTKLKTAAEITLPVDAIGVPDEWAKLPAEFAEAAGLVGPCAHRDESQFPYTHVNLHPDHVEATDQLQLCRFLVKTGMAEPVLVRPASLRHVVGMDEVGLTEGWLHFRNADGLRISCRRSEGNFQTERATELFKVKGTALTLPDGLAQAVARAEIFSGEDAVVNRVTVVLKPGSFAVRGEGPSGCHEEREKTKYDGPDMEFSIQPYLLKAICDKAAECTMAEGRILVKAKRWRYVTSTIVDEEGEDK